MLVVASASKPGCASSRAVPTSHVLLSQAGHFGVGQTWLFRLALARTARPPSIADILKLLPHPFVVFARHGSYSLVVFSTTTVQSSSGPPLLPA